MAEIQVVAAEERLLRASRLLRAGTDYLDDRMTFEELVRLVQLERLEASDDMLLLSLVEFGSILLGRLADAFKVDVDDVLSVVLRVVRENVLEQP